MKRTTLVASLVAVLALGGCAGFPPAPEPSATVTPALDVDREWFLASATDAAGPLNLTGDVLRMTIADGLISGQVCNSWGGEIAIDGSAVTIGPLAATEMYCTEPEGIMDIETRLLAGLDDVTTIELRGDELYLTGNGVELRFTPAF